MDDAVRNQQGRVNVAVIVAVVLAMGLAASVYLNVDQSRRAKEDHNLLQGQITDLKYQVSKDAAAAAAPSATPTPLATPEPSPTATPAPAVAGTAVISLTQLGVKITAADPVADLTYGMTTSGAYPVAALTTRSLVSKYAACTPSAANSALGFIVQKKVGLSSTGKLIKQIGQYNYFYLAPTASCATDQDGLNTLAAARAAIKNAVLPTLTD